MRPEVGTEAIGGEREIMIQTDAQAASQSMFVGGAELLIQLPLQILVKQNVASLFPREFLRGGGFRILILDRPGAPVPDIRMFRVNCFFERGVEGETVQQFAFALNVFCELRGARGLALPFAFEEGAEDSFQKAQFEAVDSFVFDEG